MRRLSPTLALCLLAACGARAAGPGPTTPTTTSASVSASDVEGGLDLEAACPTKDVYGYTIQRAEASGSNAGDAIAAARASATRALVERACSGFSDMRCAAVERHVKPWREGYYDRKGRWACASVSVQKNELDGLARDAAVLESELRALADATVEKIGASPLAVGAPTWGSGCSAGGVGQAVQAGLLNQLATFPQVRLVDADTRVDGSAQLLSQLAPGAGGVTLTASLRLPGELTSAPLPGFTFPLDLFDVPADEVGRCRSDRDLGLANGERIGAGGLRARVEVPGVDGVVCEGELVSPAVRVNRPALVQIYSVASNGRSLLVWPPPGVHPRVESQLPLGDMRLVATPDTGDERLVVVAVPDGADWGATKGWHGFCESPAGLGPELYPEDAAVGSTTFSVIPSGTGDCPVVRDLAALRDQVVMPAVCGVGR